MSDDEAARGGAVRAPKARWGRLKRSNSHDDEVTQRAVKPSSPRHLFKKVGGQPHAVAALLLDQGTTAAPHSNKQHGGGVFRKRQSSNEDGILRGSGSGSGSGGGSNHANPEMSATAAVVDSPTNNDPPKKPGLFARHRQRRGTRTTKKATTTTAATRESAVRSDGDSGDGDGNSGEDMSEDEGLSSDENPDNTVGCRTRNRGRRQFQDQLQEAGSGLSSQGLALRGGDNASRAESVPLRKMVSFDVIVEDPMPSQPRQRIFSSDRQLETTKAESENPAVVFGYNSIDFPIPHQVHNNNSSSQQMSTAQLSSSQLSSQQQQHRGETRQQQRERARYSVYHGKGSVKKKFRVRPYHCFPDEPMHMTEEEIYADSLTASKEFVPLKSYLAPSMSRPTNKVELSDTVRQMWGSPEEDGRIGALRVEVLGCVSLNRTKPDVSVYMVCGDSAFCTDVLSGFRSPMWPSVSRRACVFPIHHAYAKLYIGVFDVRIRKNKENDVFCGRVAVDVASIRPNTEYDTTMPLRASTFVYDKRKRGVIRLRFSLHWFSERAAVISYFKSVKSIVNSCPLVEGQPTIPCADPKTFRNVAVTVYGQDLPGKYSRNAFRSTIREFSLYQQNLQLLIKVLVMDAMLYEKPWMSLYLFGGALYCVIFNTAAMVPAFVVGYILILYIENYRHFVEDKDFHLGYKPLTIVEVFKALIMNSKENGQKHLAFEAIAVEKRTKRRRGHASHRLGRQGSKEELDNGGTAEDDENCGDIVPLDHREFPFADRDAYPKLSVEDALAPGSGKGGTGRLHGRLSVYYTPEAPTADSGSVGEDDSDNMDSDRDDETVMTESQMIGDSMFDLDSEGEEEEEMSMEGVDFNYKRAMTHQSSGTTSKRRIRLGPPQDTDVTGRKVPPQLQLKRVEAMLYKLSRGISVELVHAPPRTEQPWTASTEGLSSSSPPGMIAPSAEVQASVTKRAKKIIFDDFDKLLGLQSRNANPVHRIMSSFMGPLMRMIRVGVYLMRISFNVTTWRDPYLSFWVLVMLSSLCLLLIVFPWRLFFLVSSVVCLGPQNILLRRYLEKKAAAKEKEALDDSNGKVSQAEKRLDRHGEVTKKPSPRFGRSRDHGLDDSSHVKDKADDKTDGRRGFFSKLRHTGNETRRGARRRGSNLADEESEWVERPAFQSALHGQSSTNKKLQPRAVAIPYSRLKKERFYDWPPDPTVSRATPIALYPDVPEDPDDDSLTASVPDVVAMPDHDDHVEYPSTLRRRNSASGPEPSDIPTNIMF